jgi:hypothetical protein
MDLTGNSIGFLNEPEFSPSYGTFMPQSVFGRDIPADASVVRIQTSFPPKRQSCVLDLQETEQDEAGSTCS